MIVLLFIALLTFTINDCTFSQSGSSSQKPTSSGNREYYHNDYKSSSTLSEASDVSHRNYERRDRYDRYNQNDYKRERSYDRYERNDRNDSYTKRNERSYDRETNYTENYFRIDRSGRSLWDGKHWNYSEYPLKVYVGKSNSRYYKSVYKEYVEYAFDLWNQADNRITYTFVNSKREADVAVLFIENLGDRYSETYLGLTEYETNRKNEIEFSKVQISLIKFDDQVVSDGEIKATIIHELGHVFGLGHSDSDRDLMYPYIDENHSAELTGNELSTGDQLAVKDAVDLGFERHYVRK